MANQKPSKILELSGAYQKNPDRKRLSEPMPNESIGKCPDRLCAKHSELWDEVVRNCVEGVLTIQDRHALEIIVRGLYDICYGVADRDGVVVPVSGTDRDRVFKQMGKFGMTPVDRANVQVPDSKKSESVFGSGSL